MADGGAFCPREVQNKRNGKRPARIKSKPIGGYGGYNYRGSDADQREGLWQSLMELARIGRDWTVNSVATK